MQNDPLVTIFTPVYNCEKYIAETIQSALDQTFNDFEYLIIDDCSTDNSLGIIESFKDPRIRLIKNKSNQGIAYNRNLAIELSKGKFIAMMDADDISLPKRIEKQVNFLSFKEDYGIVGTGVFNIRENGDDNGDDVQFSLPDRLIPSRMLFNNYIYTSSVMIRKKNLTKSLRFNKDFIVAEDYELWLRLIRTCKIGHVREKLIKYRMHEGSISNTKKQLMLDTEILLIKKQLEELGCTLTPKEFDAFYKISKNNFEKYKDDFEIVNSLVTKLLLANKKSKIFSQEDFSDLLYIYWRKYFIDIKQHSVANLKKMYENGMIKLLSKEENSKLIIKSFIRHKSK